MSERKPLQAITNLGLPAHYFHIGEEREPNVLQLPNFAALVGYVCGKGRRNSPAMSVGALGGLLADAVIKQFLLSDAGGLHYLIRDVLDSAPAVEHENAALQTSFLWRLSEFLKIGLSRPNLLPMIVANTDKLSNARLKERAHSILTTGDDLGDDDLWPRFVVELPAIDGGGNGHGQ